MRPLSLRVSCAITCALFVLPWAVRAQCGGTERWPVKVGTDSGVSRVDLTQLIAISIHDVTHLAEPQRPNDNDTRLDSETHVYVVLGRLVKFKLESGRTGDSDYHLVVTDDSLTFSPPGHSVVAEIPDPNCVAGKQGDPSVQSRFQSTLVAVRTKFEHHFTNITGGWNDAGGIQVQIVGIGFFDRPHGQTGHAENNIELHPVLDICFEGEACMSATPAVGPSPSPTPSPTPVIQNPGFEDGNQGWVASQDVITQETSEKAHSGSGKAWLGGYGTSHIDTLYQQIAIPPTATTASLSFFMHISTEEQTTTQQYDTLKVQVRDSNGQVLQTLATYSNLQARTGFQLKTVDLSQFHGSTIRIYFLAKEDNGSMTSFVLDDFLLTVE